jgi:hypothetical protein
MMTEEQLEKDIWEIYNRLTTDDQCQPISWAQVQHLKEISAMCKWELERRFKRASNE